MLLLLASAHADQLIAGDHLRIHYDSTGTWNDQTVGGGLQVDHEGTWLDWAWPGYPWHNIAIGYTLDGEEQACYANSNTSSTTFESVTEADASTAAYAVSRYTYACDGVTLTQTEGWGMDTRVVRVAYAVSPESPLQDFRLGFVLDPDPEYAVDGTYDSVNDVEDTDGDGFDDLVTSLSPSRGWVLAFGACDPENSQLGHVTGWSYEVDQRITDDDGTLADHAMAIEMAPGTVTSDTELVFLTLAADSLPEVEAAWAKAQALCLGCDADGDGWTSALCGGDDCDDASAAAHPGATETWYDAIDEDCLGGDDQDQDADGSPQGKDCDDTDPDAVPGGADTWYDGVDGNCDGASDYDADADGFDSDLWGGSDCDDEDAAINPGSTETWYDGTDQDCDGNDDDQDGDTWAAGDDCDDRDPDAWPGAPGKPHDGKDSDCDGRDEDVTGDTGLSVEGACECGSAEGLGPWVLGLLLLLRRRQSIGTT